MCLLALEIYAFFPPLLEFQQNEHTPHWQQCGKQVDCARWGIRGVWAAAKEHLIVKYFCGNFINFLPRKKIYCYPPPSLKFPQNERTPPCQWCGDQVHCAWTGARGPPAVEKAVAATPLLWQNSPYFPPMWKFMHTSPPCLNFSKKCAPGITSDVATRRVTLERVPEGHQWRQRWWRAVPMVSDMVSQKKKSVGVRWNASGTKGIFVVTLA